MKKKVGIIGYGNMGSSIGEVLKNYYDVIVYDKDREKLKDIPKIKIASSNIELVKDSDIIILAVKPQDFKDVLCEIKDFVTDKFIISIAAGITIKFIKKYLKNANISRVMPNLPLKIRKGITCICKDNIKKSNLEFVKNIFKKFGDVLLVEEDLMDSATAISGSGPGFLYDIIQNKNKRELKEYIKHFSLILKKTAQKLGFNKKEADILVNRTIDGSLKYLISSKLSPSELVKKVASKGGTTEKGLEVLHRGGTIEEAIISAYKRARELSKKF